MSTLEAAEERWRLTIDHAPVGISLLTLDGSWIRVNPALCTMLGYTEAQMLASAVADHSHPDDMQADLDLLDRLAAGEITSYRLRKRYVHAEGHEVTADLSVSLVRHDDGSPMHVVGYVSDLTEEMRATARIEQLNEELTQQASRLAVSNADLDAFAMLVSHDLQTPLTTVSGYLQLLAEECAGRLDAEAISWIGRAGAAAGRMSDLVSSLLAMSRSESELQRVSVSVEQLVVDVCADLEPQVHEHGATVEVTEHDLMIVGDPARLRQLLQNLLQNALKYRDAERSLHVTVTVTVTPDGWLVTVDDNAQGVPPEQRDEIFGLFTRLSSTDESGHGIGLATCRRIVQRHGGRIWVEDNPAGPGSRFAFTLAHQDADVDPAVSLDPPA